MLSLIAAIAVAQSPPLLPDPAWYPATIFGQHIQIHGVRGEDGLVTWSRDWLGDKRIAPTELARRHAAIIDQPPLVPRPSPQIGGRPALNYGVNVDEMSDDRRILRASDPDTLRKVAAQAAMANRNAEICEVHGADKCPNGGGCKPKPAKPERKPGAIERAEMDIERLLLYAVAAVIVFAAVFVVVQASKPQP